MRVAVATSISRGCAEFAAITTPRKLDYCLRHGYSMLLWNRPYDEAVSVGLNDLLLALDDYDAVWTLDADCLITGREAIHELAYVGPHVTICREKIVDWNLLNCGSMVWMATDATRQLIRDIRDSEAEWRPMQCGWQTWLGEQANRLQMAGTLKVLGQSTIQSVAWSHGEGGCYWQIGDLVYHPCGVVPHDLRATYLRDVSLMLGRME
jgi:hypothetical protein